MKEGAFGYLMVSALMVLGLLASSAGQAQAAGHGGGGGHAMGGGGHGMGMGGRGFSGGHGFAGGHGFVAGHGHGFVGGRGVVAGRGFVANRGFVSGHGGFVAHGHAVGFHRGFCCFGNRFFFGVGVGAPFWAPWGWWGWPYYTYPWPAAYPYFGYPYPAYSGYPYAYSASAAAPVQPPEYVGPETAPSAAWYFCQNPQGYYPYVQQCPGGWQPVSPQPPAQTQ